MIPVDFQLDAEDAGSLIVFIDHFLPMLDITDADSRDTAMTVFEVRQTIHRSMGYLGKEVPEGVRPG